MKMKLHAKLIFIWKVSHLDSFWNRGTRTRKCPIGEELTNQNVAWEQEIAIFFLNKPLTLKNTSNYIATKLQTQQNLCEVLRTSQECLPFVNWYFQSEILYALQWFQFRYPKMDFKLNFSSEIGVYMTQTIMSIITFLPLREATSPLFSIYGLIGWFSSGWPSHYLQASSKICVHWSSRARGDCVIRQFAIRTKALTANLVRLVRASASSVPFFTIRFRCKPWRMSCGLILLLSS